MFVGELAKAVGVSDGILRRLAKMGVIPAKRLPGKRDHWRFATNDLEKIRAALFDTGVIEEEVKEEKKRKKI